MENILNLSVGQMWQDFASKSTHKFPFGSPVLKIGQILKI